LTLYNSFAGLFTAKQCLLDTEQNAGQGRERIFYCLETCLQGTTGKIMEKRKKSAQ